MQVRLKTNLETDRDARSYPVRGLTPKQIVARDTPGEHRHSRSSSDDSDAAHILKQRQHPVLHEVLDRLVLAGLLLERLRPHFRKMLVTCTINRFLKRGIHPMGRFLLVL